MFVHKAKLKLILPAGAAPDLSPPRARTKPPTAEGRKFSWATQRIHDLEKEVEQARARIRVCAWGRSSVVCVNVASAHREST